MLLLHTAVGELGDRVEVRPTHSALPRRPLELAHCLIAWGTKGSGIGAIESSRLEPPRQCSDVPMRQLMGALCSNPFS